MKLYFEPTEHLDEIANMFLNGHRITRQQFGLIDKMTPYRNQLYLDNLGRMTGSRPIVENNIDYIEEGNKLYNEGRRALKRAYLPKKRRSLSKDERKERQKEFKEQLKIDRQDIKDYKTSIKNMERDTLNAYSELYNGAIGEFYNFYEHEGKHPNFEEYIEKENSIENNGKFDIYNQLEDYSIKYFNPIYNNLDEIGKNNSVFSVKNNDILKNKKFKISNSKNGLFKYNDVYNLSYNEENKNNRAEIKGYTVLSDNNEITSLFEKDSDEYTVKSEILLDKNEEKKDIISYTDQYFQMNYLKTMINRYYDNSNNKEYDENYESGEYKKSLTQSAIDKEYGVSKGRNLLKAGAPDTSTGYENPYCRVWTSLKQYERLSDSIRSSGIYTDFGVSKLEGYRPYNGSQRLSDNSVLMNNGLPRIAPTEKENVKRCMFSIENLAWKDMFPNNSSYNDLKNVVDPYEYDKIMSMNIKYDEKIEKIKQLEKNNQHGKILSGEQIGPNGGRIMWFPPYNLTFNENINSEWNGTKFIGRGENIYTYINTERSGTLSFTLLVDHPSVVDKWQDSVLKDGNGMTIKEKEDFLLRYFAGCFDDSNKCEDKNNSETEEVVEENEVITGSTDNKKHIYSIVYFPNNYSGYVHPDDKNNIDRIEYLISGIGDKIEKDGNGYEIKPGKGLSTGIKDPVLNNRYYYLVDYDRRTEKLNPENYKDLDSTCMNSNVESAIKNMSGKVPGINKNNTISFYDLYRFIENKEIDTDNDLILSLKNIKSKDFNGKIKINCRGYASSHGTGPLKLNKNIELSDRRGRSIKKWIYDKLSPVLGDKLTSDFDKAGEENVLKVKGEDVRLEDPKRSRFCLVEIIIADTTQTSIANKSQKAKDKEEMPSRIFSNTIKEDANNGISFYDDEYKYFKDLEQNDSRVYQNLIDKVKFFNPVFHSITPEGFNARLTFLHQCTRQGPTNSVTEKGMKGDTMRAGNLSFGRPPFCILRIGDFYNTKIAIDSMSISYGDGSPQWDLNPEGIGIQPMMAKIDLNFKFLGGSDLSGPIEELQNAVSFNFFSNTSSYDRRSTYFNKNNKDD